ncbi:MAG: hypothetical protein IT381_17270 [Deltaproteobacteria bacterium]|nr:hypothetical protein [Deltaproteobacteria bacterium]
MEIFTLNVGQGQFVVVTGQKEAFIVDSYFPMNPDKDVQHVIGALAKILPGKDLKGLIVTGFDADHFNEVGLKIILNKYRPDWVMYPTYFKNTATADTCFALIDGHTKDGKCQRRSVALTANTHRYFNDLANEFYFELFSPHANDRTSSNNCSIVCKVVEVSTKRSYLITGDTENSRWKNIVTEFGGNLAADVLAAAHHGSNNGCSLDWVKLVRPDTVLISAGVNNKYGHPDAAAVAVYRSVAKNVFQTNAKTGISIRTVANTAGVESYVFT